MVVAEEEGAPRPPTWHDSSWCCDVELAGWELAHPGDLGPNWAGPSSPVQAVPGHSRKSRLEAQVPVSCWGQRACEPLH